MTILLNTCSLDLYKIYRNYLGKLYMEAMDKKTTIDLGNDMNSRAIRRVIDCPDTRVLLYDFWETAVL
jgi:hypothetical protein